MFILLLSTMAYVPQVQAPEKAVAAAVTVELALVRPLSPVMEIDGDPHGWPARLREFKMGESRGHYQLKAGEDPNPVYRRARPFPVPRIIGVHPFSPFGGPSNHLGIQRVEASSLQWPWPPSDVSSIPESKKVIHWRWEPPDSLRNYYWSEVGGGGVERFWAVCLQNARKPNSEPSNPRLFYFDTKSGLRWQATIPVKQTLEALRIAPPAHDWRGDVKVFLGVNADASRVLALVSRPDRRSTFLFVYAGNGDLLHSKHFAGGEALPNGSPSWSLLRRPSGNRFVISLQPMEPDMPVRGRGRGGHVDSPPPEPAGAFLIDPEGELLARLVDDRGGPVLAWQISETNVLSTELWRDNVARYFIFALP